MLPLLPEHSLRNTLVISYVAIFLLKCHLTIFLFTFRTAFPSLDIIRFWSSSFFVTLLMETQWSFGSNELCYFYGYVPLSRFRCSHLTVPAAYAKSV